MEAEDEQPQPATPEPAPAPAAGVHERKTSFQQGAWARIVRQHVVSPTRQTFYLWRENVPALHLFNAVSSQWRTDFGHRTGLDYAGVRAAPAFHRIRPARRREAVFEDVCTIERAWLDARAKHEEAERALKANRPPPGPQAIVG